MSRKSSNTGFKHWARVVTNALLVAAVAGADLVLVADWAGLIDVPTDFRFSLGVAFVTQLALPVVIMTGLRTDLRRRLWIAAAICLPLAIGICAFGKTLDLLDFGASLWTLIVLSQNLLCFFVVALLVGLWHMATGQANLQYRIAWLLTATATVAVTAAMFRTDEVWGIWTGANVLSAAVSITGVLVSRSWRSAVVALPITLIAIAGLLWGEISWMAQHVSGWGGLVAVILTYVTGLQAGALVVVCGLLRMTGVMQSAREAFSDIISDPPKP